MTIASWNIKWGGAERWPQITQALIQQTPDIIALQEYQPAASANLMQALHEAGWCHQVVTAPPLKYGGVAVASKLPVEERAGPAALKPFAHRYLSLDVPDRGIAMRIVYGPLHRDPFAEFWDGMLADLSAARDRRVLVLGDFNAGDSACDSTSGEVFCSDFFNRLPACGYRDLWRQRNGDAREYTWLGRVHPYRLDHAFATDSLVALVKGCRYDHSVRERAISDHSLMLMTVN
jgi:exonuclease III